MNRTFREKSLWLVLVALCVSLVAEGNFLFTHVLLAFWVLAELVDIGSQLVLYRRWG